MKRAKKNKNDMLKSKCTAFCLPATIRQYPPQRKKYVYIYSTYPALSYGKNKSTIQLL